jgi:soluble lytic murein transglycosylase
MFFARLTLVCTAGAWVAPPVRAQAPAQASENSGAALVLAARGYDRANQFDSARGGYEAAALVLPSIADWLRLRAAGVTPDSTSRARDYASISAPAARGRIPWTEAQARERMGDPLGAARLYDSLGAPVDAFRNDATVLALAADSASRRALCGRIVAYIVAHSGSANARAATEVLDHTCAPLPLASELIVARSAAATGPLPRALAAFDRLATEPDAPPLAAGDNDAYGIVLGRSHRDADAVRVFGTLTQPGVAPALAHAAQYQRARAMVAEGDKTHATRALRSLVRAAPHDTAAADALMLLADLATDDRDDAAARQDFLQVVHRFPSSSLAPRAEFRAALIAFISGGSARAAQEWDQLNKTYPRAPDATAALYWSGRAWARAGRTARAADRWRSVMSGDPLSYYATLSARRLHRTDSLGADARDTAVHTVPAYMSAALLRAALLDSLGMAVEAHFEIDRVVRQAGDTPDAILAAGDALVRAGEASRAVGLGWRLVGLASGAVRDPRVLRLIYPLAFGDTLAVDAKARGLDPALVAAVIREESAFNPRATSGVGARGLMQVMPAIGRQLAEARRLGPWDPSLLDDPGINLSLGVAHLATFQSQEGGSLERTLAAYNAGPSRVKLWAAKRGADDPEVFVERIPFTDTRDYVRAIVHGRDVYAELYGL